MSNLRRAARRERALNRLRAQAGVVLSQHALVRAKELGFDESEVLRCVESPEQTYGETHGTQAIGASISVRIACVLSTEPLEQS